MSRASSASLVDVVLEAHSAFAPEPASVGAARRFVRDVLHQWERHELADLAVLLTSELATNVLLHARTAFRVVVQHTPAGVRVAVHDRSTARPVAKHFAVDACTGRGLRLLDDLAAAWGVTTGSRLNEAKAVWFQVEQAGEVAPTPGDPDLEAWLALDAAVQLDATGRPDEQLVDVWLLQLPLDVYRRAQQHSEELIRELRLVTSEESQSVPGRLSHLISELAVRYGPLNPAAERQLQAALEQGDGFTDLLYRVPPQVAEDVRALDALLREADDYCRTGDSLLTLATPPEALAFRRWVFGEIVHQIGGEAPVPWPAIGAGGDPADRPPSGDHH